MKRYNPSEIEPKWQKIWEKQQIYKAEDNSSKQKKYVLEYFPYPSGAAMHVGHVRNYTIGDAIARFSRMNGYNVLHPMGWDAFGLPAENYAIKHKVSPQVAIEENTKKFKQQLIQMGFSYDWSREINSTDPKYYRWTQWLFLLLYKRGLAYRQESLQWWCPVDKTVLANEQVENGRCWRCGHEVEKKSLKQWFFKITDYADRLEKDLDLVDWSDSIKRAQRNWIGHKTGINITYKIINSNSAQDITCFTTRPDTNYGATFVVLAPEHLFVQKVISQEVTPTETPSHWQAVEHYVQKAMSKSELERKEEGRLKTGVFTGFYVVNPLNKRKLPVWVSDFVLSNFGTGAVVGVPGHDLRDFEFAKQFDLPIERVVVGPDKDTSPITKPEQVQEKSGKMINSGPLDGLDIQAAIEKMKDLMVEKKQGKRTHSYSIRDWLISRQRYWGAPIPIVYCEKCGVVPVPEDQLPVVLPEVDNFEPSSDGRSPLSRVAEFVDTTCPKCDGPAKRETDTMDGFACSSWYFLRFADPHNDKQAFAKTKADFWLPVDDYIGGAEHAVMHLLYARFWTKVMYDEGLINFQEPFTKLRNHGMILAPDGQKMSKSKGNTIEPDSLIGQGYGADTIRIMELFIGPWDQVVNWSVEGVGGAFRFLQRIWDITNTYAGSAKNDPLAEETNNYDDAPIWRAANQVIKRVTLDFGDMGFNTAVAGLMEYVNTLYKLRVSHPMFKKDGQKAWEFALNSLVQLLAPLAPHISEELWGQLGHEDSVHLSSWPKWDEATLARDKETIVIQVNGKLRSQIIVDLGLGESEVVKLAKEDKKSSSYLKGKKVIRSVYVAKKLVNFVTD